MDPIDAKKLILKHQAAVKASKTLEKAISRINSIEAYVAVGESLEETKDYLQDSIVQRFEYTFDSVWKYLKIYLEKELMVDVQIQSPAAIFREYLRIGFFTEDQIALALNMLKHRNETTHTYYQELVDEICKRIPDYYKLMALFLEKTKPNSSDIKA